VFDPNLNVSTSGTIVPSRSIDYPTIITFGPSFFESYSTWPNTKFIHGFNLGRNSTEARTALLQSVPLACQALRNGSLAYWELGNEPDLFKTSSQGIVRPSTWNESAYVAEWLNGTRSIRQVLAAACPEMATDAAFKWYAPSFAGTRNSLNPVVAWQDGLDVDRDISIISSHKYAFPLL